MLTLAVKGAIWWLLSFAKGVWLLTRDAITFIERVHSLSLGLRVVKWVCGFVEQVGGRLVKRMCLAVSHLLFGGLGTERGTWKSVPEPGREFGKFLTSLDHPPFGGVDRGGKWW